MILCIVISQVGQEYYISDGKPVNNFEFFRPLVGSCKIFIFLVEPSSTLLLPAGGRTGVHISSSKTASLFDLFYR